MNKNIIDRLPYTVMERLTLRILSVIRPIRAVLWLLSMPAAWGHPVSSLIGCYKVLIHLDAIDVAIRHIKRRIRRSELAVDQVSGKVYKITRF